MHLVCEIKIYRWKLHMAVTFSPVQTTKPPFVLNRQRILTICCWLKLKPVEIDFLEQMFQPKSPKTMNIELDSIKGLKTVIRLKKRAIIVFPFPGGPKRRITAKLRLVFLVVTIIRWLRFDCVSNPRNLFGNRIE